MKSKELFNFKHTSAINKFDEILQHSKIFTHRTFKKGMLVGPYRVALLNLKCKIAVDVDMSAPLPDNYKSQSSGKDRFLAGLGYKLIRFSEQQIYEQPDHVLRVIEEAVERYGGMIDDR